MRDHFVHQVQRRLESRALAVLASVVQLPRAAGVVGTPSSGSARARRSSL
jgi:hypothetical protein